MAKTAPGKSETNASGRQSTKDRILHTSARLFAERGFENVTLRDITQAADANIAAVNYHFGSKVGLLARVFEHYAEPINRQRMALLDAYEARSASELPDVGALMNALLEPTFRACETEPSGRYFQMMLGQMSSSPNPDVRQILFDAFDHVAERFTGLLETACPDLSREEFFWRLTCFYGAMMYAQANNGRIASLSGGKFDSGDFVKGLDYIVPFLTAGMDRAPTP